jgi:23S rRNA pseudouridine2605 synthase
MNSESRDDADTLMQDTAHRRDRPRVRLQRVLADAGVAARRRCEQLIEEGRVEVNGEVRSSLPVFVDPTRDLITVDGKAIARQPSRGVRFTYIVMHKPPRTLCTSADEPEIGRVTVLDLVDHPAKSRLFPVGRLGWNESGLVLLTNDGEMANRLSHPRYGVPKVYLAAVKGDVREGDLKNLTKEMYKLQRLESRRSGRVGTAGRGSHVEVEIANRARRCCD